MVDQKPENSTIDTAVTKSPSSWYHMTFLSCISPNIPAFAPNKASTVTLRKVQQRWIPELPEADQT